MKSLGYLCSEFPAISHTFISREIEVLEQAGFQIHTAAINPTKNLQMMTTWEKEKEKSTYYLKATPILTILGLVFRYLLQMPTFFRILFYCINLTIINGPKNIIKGLGYFVESILLHQWAKKKAISHIHVHFANGATTVALLASQFRDLSFSVSVHGPDEFYIVDASNLREKFEGALFVRCISYFCQSQVIRLLPSTFWNKIHIVRCGLFPNEFGRVTPSNEIKRIICVGRLSPNKGQTVLLEAAKRLRDNKCRFHISFLGGGPFLEELSTFALQSGLQDYVTFTGSVGLDRVKEELRISDIFVLPSFAEGIPVALMEAMAVGIPVVSTFVAGIPELINNGVDGFLTEASNHDQLAQILEILINEKIDTQLIIQKAQEKVRNLYDVQKNTDQLAHVFYKYIPTLNNE